MLTDIDTRLTADGDRWRRATPLPDLDALLPDALLLDAPLVSRAGASSHGRRTRWFAVAAAAVVVGATATTALMLDRQGAATPAAGSGTAGSSPVTTTGPASSATGPTSPAAVLSPLVIQPDSGTNITVRITIRLTAGAVGGLQLGHDVKVGFVPQDERAPGPLRGLRLDLDLLPGVYHPQYSRLPSQSRTSVLAPLFPASGYRPCTPGTITVSLSGPKVVDLTC